MHPILLELPFGLAVYAYGAMLFLSVIIGRVVALHLAERNGMNAMLMNRCTIWMLAGAIIGARLLFVVTSLDRFDSLFQVFEIWNGGVVAYGGFLGGFFATVVFCRVHRVALLPWLDCVAPTLCIGLLLTRIGCFLAGCDFGQPWDGPWAVHFPAGSIAYREQVLQGLLPASATQSLAVHPTQLYESITGLALLLVVIAIRRRRTSPGYSFIAVVVGYAAVRSAIEVVRGDFGRGYAGIFSTSQLIALVTFVSAAVFIYLQRCRTIGAVRTDGPAAV